MLIEVKIYNELLEKLERNRDNKGIAVGIEMCLDHIAIMYDLPLVFDKSTCRFDHKKLENIID